MICGAIETYTATRDGQPYLIVAGEDIDIVESVEKVSGTILQTNVEVNIDTKDLHKLIRKKEEE